MDFAKDFNNAGDAQTQQGRKKKKKKVLYQLVSASSP